MEQIKQLLSELNEKMATFTDNRLELAAELGEYAVYEITSWGATVGRSMVRGDKEKVAAFLEDINKLPVR